MRSCCTPSGRRFPVSWKNNLSGAMTSPRLVFLGCPAQTPHIATHLGGYSSTRGSSAVVAATAPMSPARASAIRSGRLPFLPWKERNLLLPLAPVDGASIHQARRVVLQPYRREMTTSALRERPPCVDIPGTVRAPSRPDKSCEDPAGTCLLHRKTAQVSQPRVTLGRPEQAERGRNLRSGLPPVGMGLLTPRLPRPKRVGRGRNLRSKPASHQGGPAHASPAPCPKPGRARKEPLFQIRASRRGGRTSPHSASRPGAGRLATTAARDPRRAQRLLAPQG